MEKICNCVLTDEWIEGYPIADGRQGAMVCGKADKERVTLNHDLLWRRFTKLEKKQAYKMVPKLTELVRESRFDDAESLMRTKFAQTGETLYVNPFVTAGEFLYQPIHNGPIQGIKRSLDMENQIVTTEYDADGIHFTRYYTVLQEEGLIVGHFLSDRGNALNGKLTLTRVEDSECRCQGYLKDGQALLNFEFEEGVRFAVAMKVLNRGGRVTGRVDHYEHNFGMQLQVKGIQYDRRNDGDVMEGMTMGIDSCDEILVLIKIITDLESNDPAIDATECLKTLQEDLFDQLQDKITENSKKFSEIFNRTRLEISGEKKEESVDSLVRKGLSEEVWDGRLVEIVFNLGKYLAMVSGLDTKKGSVPKAPINLQGIWCEYKRPPWDCDYHLDLNVQQCYWPLAAIGMADYLLPLMAWVEKLLPKAREAAQDLYGCRGAFYNLVADYNEMGTPDSMMYPWTTAGAWLVQILAMYYDYTEDQTYLKDHLYPFAKEIGVFFEDFLVEENGKFYMPFSASMEANIAGRHEYWSFISSDSTCDIALIRELFRRLMSFSRILDKDSEKVCLWEKIYTSLPETKLGKNGEVLEWFDESLIQTDIGHRHRCHLISFCPAGTMPDTKEYREGVKKALKIRKENVKLSNVGWASVWDMQIFARLRDAENAEKELQKMLRNNILLNGIFAGMSFRLEQGEVWFDGDKLFQIECCIGIVASITECIIQSHHERIQILPCVIPSMKTGKMSGVRLPRSGMADIVWENFRLISASICFERSGDYAVEICCPGEYTVYKNGVHVCDLNSRINVLHLQAESVYEIRRKNLCKTNLSVEKGKKNLFL